MTLVVGFVAGDRAVMAADSQATEADGTRTTIDKIWCERGLLIGYAGPHAIRDRLQRVFAHKLSASDPEELRSCDTVAAALCSAARPTLEAIYQNYVPDHGEHPKSRLGGQVLVLGCDGTDHWLLEIDADNTPTPYTDNGFHAAGSGSPAAQVAMALLESYVPAELTLRELGALAYRTVLTSVRVLAHAVGEPVVLWSSDGNGSFTKATDTEIDDIERFIEAWTTGERESLRMVEVADEQKPPLPARQPDKPG